MIWAFPMKMSCTTILEANKNILLFKKKLPVEPVAFFFVLNTNLSLMKIRNYAPGKKFPENFRP